MSFHDAATIINHAPPSLSLSRPLPGLTGASPRSSMSGEGASAQSPRAGHSPFLHNLSNRFRKGSNASSSMSSEPASPALPPDPHEKTETTQSAKRFLLSIVRSDWTWPASPTAQPSEQDIKKNEALASREPVGWRTRQEGASDIDLDSDGSATGLINGTPKKKKRRPSDAYKFENPDAVATSIVERKLKRKRKLEAEMEWNNGLRVWNHRRDAWTGAVSTVPTKRTSADSERHTQSISPLNTEHQSNQSRLSQDLTPALVDGTSEPSAAPKPPTCSSIGSNISPILSSTVAADVASDITAADASSIDPNCPYLPIYPPLFPSSHTLRSRIRPTAYPTIYSKVVVQSLTPNVPIPLTHMIGALVDGWKAEGQWPPPMTPQEETLARKRRSKAKGDSTFGRWRKERQTAHSHSHSNSNPLVNPHEADGFIVNEQGGMSLGFVDGNDAAVEGNAMEVDGGEVKRGHQGFRRSISKAVRGVLGLHDSEEDGGLERLGVRFLDGDEESSPAPVEGDEGLLKENRRVEEANRRLNRGLLEGGGNGK